jgi:hypothetical protein
VGKRTAHFLLQHCVDALLGTTQDAEFSGEFEAGECILDSLVTGVDHNDELLLKVGGEEILGDSLRAFLIIKMVLQGVSWGWMRLPANSLSLPGPFAFLQTKRTREIRITFSEIVMNVHPFFQKSSNRRCADGRHGAHCRCHALGIDHPFRGHLTYAPLQANVTGIQSVYLTELAPAFAEVLAGLIGEEAQTLIAGNFVPATMQM